MTGTNNASGLKWKTLAKKRRSATQGIPPGTEALQWVANTVTLIYGDRDAVLVDTFLSAEQTRELVDWIAASGKNLTAIYVTHAHGDHFFGIGMLEERFPGHARWQPRRSSRECATRSRRNTWPRSGALVFPVSFQSA